MYTVDWAVRNRRNFLEFSRILKECKNPRIYQTDFIHALVDEFWEKNQSKLKFRFFTPWLSYMICAFFFFESIGADGLWNENDQVEDQVYKATLTAITLCLFIYQIIVESQQFASVQFSEYTGGGWNWINVSHFLTAGYSYVIMFLKNDDALLTHWTTGAIRSLALLTLWSNFFDWLRLFDKTSFYIKLVERTFIDIVQFLVLFIIALSMIGSAMYALEQGTSEGDSNIIEPVFNFFYFDAIYNQYLLSLGEFTMDGFDDHENMELVYVLFIFATLFTQITFLNMLIAIMSNTFEQVMEKKNQYALDNKLSFMADYYDVFNFKQGRPVDAKVYLYMVSPLLSSEQSAESQESDDWEGGIAYLKKSIQLRLKQTQKKVMDQASRHWEATKKMNDEKFEKSCSERARMQTTLNKLETTLSKQSSEIQKYSKSLSDYMEKRSQKEAEKEKEKAKEDKGEEEE